MSEQFLSDNDVLYEDNHLIAIRKNSTVLVQGDESGDRSLVDSLAEYLKSKYGKTGNVFTGLIHRIDRPVSGLVLFAKTSKALARMNKIFQSREVVKTYLCVVEGRVDEIQGELESYLIKDNAKNKSFASVRPKKKHKHALLKFRLVGHLQRYSVLEIKPLTGRHHQIRVQLSGAGHPIKGDLKYGAKHSNSDGSISLHAYSLNFRHPVKKTEITIRAPLPLNDIWNEVQPFLKS